MDPRLTRRWIDEGKLPAFQKLLAPGRRFPAAPDEPPAPEPRRLVEFHHRHGPRRPRHLRFHPPRPEDLYPHLLRDRDLGRRRRPSGSARPSSPSRAARSATCARARPSGRSSRSTTIPATDLQDPVQLPAGRDEAEDALRDGDARPQGLLRHLQLLHERVDGGHPGGRRRRPRPRGLRHRQPRRGRAPRPGEQPSGRTPRRRPSPSRSSSTPRTPWPRSSSRTRSSSSRRGSGAAGSSVRFDLIPTQSVSGICLFYLKEVRPKFKLYVSPVNIDPARPGPAHLDPRVLRQGARAALRPLLHQGPAGRHERPRQRRPRRGGVPGAGRHGPRGEPGHVRVRARPVRSRPPLLSISRTPTSASTCSGA